MQDDREELSEELFTTLEDLNRHPRSYDNILDFLETGPKLNQKGVVLLYKQALRFNPNSGNDVVGLLLAVLKYSLRHKFVTAYSHEWKQVKDHLDQALVKSLSVWKASNLKTKLWWEAHRSYIGDICPTAETDACMEVLQDYARVETELCTVVASSAIGLKLFGNAHNQYQGSKLSVLMLSILSDLQKKDITLETIAAARKKFVEEAVARGKGPKESIPKRAVEVSYRGADFALMVHSHYDGYLMREACMVEGMACDVGTLQPLFCEEHIIGDSRQKGTAKVAKEVVATAELVRKAAQAAVVSESPSGDVILNALNANSAQFIQLHRAWRVSAAFWASVVGAGVERRLQAEVLACFNTEGGAASIDKAIKLMEKLGRSKLVSFCGLSLQAMFTSCQSFLADIKCNRPPKYDGTQDSGFLKRVMEKVSHFLVFTPPSADGKCETLRGAEAATAKLVSLLIRES